MWLPWIQGKQIEVVDWSEWKVFEFKFGQKVVYSK